MSGCSGLSPRRRPTARLVVLTAHPIFSAGLSSPPPSDKVLYTGEMKVLNQPAALEIPKENEGHDAGAKD